tara:strand:- start:68 stop:613 length:546 start_codon:yes stop_codon:yes gene_type:complete
MILGLTGKNASGKGAVAEYLKSKGYTYLSLSDALRDQATKRNLEHTRDNLINLGNQLRQEFGSNYLAKKTLEKISEGNFIIDSIRNPEEINELKTHKDFTLIAVDAPIELRFERMQSRARPGDATSVEQLKEHEAKENTSNKTSQQLNTCIEMAQHTINNQGTLEELHNKIDQLLEEINND